MNQKLAMLNYLKKNKKGLTIWTAVSELGITCPHKRFAELLEDGHELTKTWEYGVNRYGNNIRIRRYKMK